MTRSLHAGPHFLEIGMDLARRRLEYRRRMTGNAGQHETSVDACCNALNFG
ncbi:MAG: hypothetical protein AB7F89_24615 [Pirellulaceae bacterium]